MKIRRTVKTRWLSLCFAGLAVGACSSSTPATHGTGGATENGGTASAGGETAPDTGGAVGSGGVSSAGGATA